MFLVRRRKVVADDSNRQCNHHDTHHHWHTSQAPPSYSYRHCISITCSTIVRDMMWRLHALPANQCCMLSAKYWGTSMSACHTWGTLWTTEPAESDSAKALLVWQSAAYGLQSRSCWLLTKKWESAQEETNHSVFEGLGIAKCKYVMQLPEDAEFYELVALPDHRPKYCECQH